MLGTGRARGGQLPWVLPTLMALACGPVAAQESEGGGWSFGGSQGESFDAHTGPWFPRLAGSSTLRGGSAGGAGREGARLRSDLGVPSHLVAGVLELSVPLGVAGTLGGDVIFTGAEDQGGVVGRPIELDEVLFDPGDVARTDLRLIWTRLIYAYDIRYELELGQDLSLGLFAGPMIVFGDWDVDLRTRRVAPAPSGLAHEHMNAWLLSIGGRIGVELAETFRVGADLEVIPGAELSFSSTEIVEWQRARFYVGLTLGVLDVTAGYRFLHTVAEGRGEEEVDVTLEGVDVLVGVSF